MRQNRHRLLKVFLFYENVVCIICGYCKYPNLIFSKNIRYRCQNPHQREVQNTLNSESFPSILTLYRFFRNTSRLTYERQFFICFPDEVKIRCKVSLGQFFNLAYSQIVVESFKFHIVLTLALLFHNTVDAFYQRQTQNDVYNSVMLHIEFPDQHPAEYPCTGSYCTDCRYQKFKSDQDKQRCAVIRDIARQCCNAKHINFDIYKLKDKSLPE